MALSAAPFGGAVVVLAVAWANRARAVAGMGWCFGGWPCQAGSVARCWPGDWLCLGFRLETGGLAALLWRRLRPVRAWGLSLWCPCPWYAAMLVWKGGRFWDAFRLIKPGSVQLGRKRPPAALVVFPCPVDGVAQPAFTPCLDLGLAGPEGRSAARGTTRGEGVSERRPASSLIAQLSPPAGLLGGGWSFFTWRPPNCPVLVAGHGGCALCSPAARTAPAGACRRAPDCACRAHPLGFHLHPALVGALDVSAMGALITIGDAHLPAGTAGRSWSTGAAFWLPHANSGRSLAMAAGLELHWLESGGLAGRGCLACNCPCGLFHLFASLRLWAAWRWLRGLPVRENGRGQRRGSQAR